MPGVYITPPKSEIIERLPDQSLVDYFETYMQSRLNRFLYEKKTKTSFACLNSIICGVLRHFRIEYDLRTHPPIVDAGGVQWASYCKKKLEEAIKAEESYFATNAKLDPDHIIFLQQTVNRAHRKAKESSLFMKNSLSKAGGVTILYFDQNFEPDSLDKFMAELEQIDEKTKEHTEHSSNK